jgi:TRAP-type C4-dicarboxylate transport system permease small subunit
MNNLLQRLARSMALAAGTALLAIAVLVSLEVILRKIFMISLNAGAEISSYVLAIVASWGFSFALFERVHVRIDALIRLLPKRISCYSDVISGLGLAIFSLALTWFAYTSLAESWGMQSRSMTPLSIPMWIPQGIWVFGLLVFSVCCITLLIRGTYLVMKKRLDEASALIGNPSMEMEALTEAGLEITTESLSREGGDK